MNDMIGTLLQTAAENGEDLTNSPDLLAAIKGLRDLADTLERNPERVIAMVMAIARHREDGTGADIEQNSVGTAPGILGVGLAMQRSIEADFGTLIETPPENTVH